MLIIAGLGYAYPQGVVSNSLLSEIRPDLREQLGLNGIESRASLLQESYLRQNGNVDPWQSTPHFTERPFDIALEAARMAIQRAGIQAEEIGLIIGECATPFETTPSEAQRVGKGLGLKVPAYDVSSVSSALLHYLSLLSSWRDESIPTYCLCVSSNYPTQRVNFRQGQEALYFGDGSGALLLSSRKEGRYRLRDSFYRIEVLERDLMRFPLYENASIETGALQIMEERMREMLQNALRKNNLDSKRIYLIGNQLDSSALRRVAASAGISEQQIVSNLEERAYSLGSSSLLVAAENWDRFRSGDIIVVAEAGAGFGMGYAVIERR